MDLRSNYTMASNDTNTQSLSFTQFIFIFCATKELYSYTVRTSNSYLKTIPINYHFYNDFSHAFIQHLCLCLWGIDPFCAGGRNKHLSYST